jgi:hypothetical protein
MIGMVMRQKHRIEITHLGRQQLLSQVRPGIDEDHRIFMRDKDRRAAAAIAWIGGVAIAPIAGAIETADARHATRRAGAQHRHPHGFWAFPNKSKIIDAVDFTNPKVRNFALSATTKHFINIKQSGKTRRLIQCFAVFKEIRNRWNYVDDPRGREYIASATESLQHFSGDCDDHAILMAACIKTIGGTPRIIHTGGHLYPEILIGNRIDLETAIYFIKEVLFVKESYKQQIFYHIDERGQIWLNLDYTATYPGGKFMSEEILGALTFN